MLVISPYLANETLRTKVCEMRGSHGGDYGEFRISDELSRVCLNIRIPSSNTLKLEAGRSPETLVSIRIRGVSIPEDRNRNIHHHENVTSHVLFS